MASDPLYEVWSDGSCLGNPGPGGWAAIVFRATLFDAEICGRAAHSTNQRMELQAAAEGLEAVPEGASVILRTDSKYLVDGMKSWVSGWKRRGWKKPDGSAPSNLDLWQRLDALAGSRSVDWLHVRGHAGVEMNERCDRLANAAAHAAKAEHGKGTSK